ncbi:MAG: hypothetical protein ABRQ27_05160 [Clostridiaceae bacterium]
MNIIYNNGTEPQEPELFKLMEEFVYTRLKDKSLFNKITLEFNETEDKENGLSYKGMCIFLPEPGDPFTPIIQISDYAVRLSAQAIALSGKEIFNTFEKYRLKVIFHELGHLVVTYNDAHKLYLKTRDDELSVDYDEEDLVNQMMEEFLKEKNFI